MPHRFRRPNRYDHKARGEWFVTWLIVVLAGIIALYVLLHAYRRDACDPCRTPSLDSMVVLTAEGEVVVVDAFALDWFVGDDKAKPILERTARRFEVIQQLRLDVPKLIVIARQRSDALNGSFVAVGKAAEAGEYEKAQALLLEALAPLATSTRDDLLVIGDLDAKLQQLSLAKGRQKADRLALQPSKIQTVFWTDPVNSLWEVLFAAFVGVLTNLLMQTSEHLRRGTYVPAERWTGYSKLAYGPMLALIVVLAIMNGWIDPGYKTRVWTLPLVGFILGYASRRTAALIDRLSEAFLGRAFESVAAGPAAAAAAGLARAEALLQAARPRSLAEMKTLGQTLVREVANAKVFHKETKS